MLQIFRTDLKYVIGLIADRHDVNGKPNRLILKGRKSNTKSFLMGYMSHINDHVDKHFYVG